MDAPRPTMRYQLGMGAPLLMVAAEASADAHAAGVVRALREAGERRPIYGIAGPLMRAEGVEAVAKTEELSVMGIVAVVKVLPRIRRVVQRLMKRVEHDPPAAALLLDSPDLNLRLAKTLKARGIPIIYYIGPTLWAWRSGRAKLIQKRVDRMLVIFPFEKAFYAGLGVEAEYVGNPLVDVDKAEARHAGQALRRALKLEPNHTLVALLPGSRRAEIERCLPDMLRAGLLLQEKHPALNFALPVAPTLDQSWVASLCAAHAPALKLTLLDCPARSLLEASTLAAVVSGTATLEAALAEVPTVVVYRLSGFAWSLAKRLVKIPHWSLINLIAEQEVVRERLQEDATPLHLAADLEALLPGQAARERVLKGLQEVSRRLGTAGAGARVAEVLVEVLQGNGRGPGSAPGGRGED